MDAIAGERQFLDHLAPVWRTLQAPERGRFLVDPSLVDHAATRGIDAEAYPPELGSPGSRPTRVPPTRRPAGRRALVASYGDTKLGRRLGYGDFAFLEHGIAQTYRGDPRSPQLRNGSYSGGADRDDTSLFLVPNDRAAELWRAAYPDAAVETVGSPRLDTLPARVPDPFVLPEPVVAISFHWPAQGIAPEAGTAYGHFGGVLATLARSYRVIGHAHPRGDWPAILRQRYVRAGIEWVADFDDVCRRSDVYVCDNSSTIYEYASTGRPVVVLNTPMYRRGVEHGLRFWEAANVGVNVDHPDDLVAGIAAALEDSPERRRAREAALDVVYAHRTGAADRAAAVLREWATAPVRVAA